MDPPYNKGLWRPVLARLKSYDLIADDGVIILEESVEAELDTSGFTVMADKHWGAARVLFLKPT